MEASIFCSTALTLATADSNSLSESVRISGLRPPKRCFRRIVITAGSTSLLKGRVAALHDVSSVADPAPAQLTWQIVVGSIAGVTPFIVAGIEFGKRIATQRRCQVCKGSGLVMRDRSYFRCPECGGFLPWQSWKRFFSG